MQMQTSDSHLKDFLHLYLLYYMIQYSQQHEKCCFFPTAGEGVIIQQSSSILLPTAIVGLSNEHLNSGTFIWMHFRYIESNSDQLYIDVNLD